MKSFWGVDKGVKLIEKEKMNMCAKPAGKLTSEEEKRTMDVYKNFSYSYLRRSCAPRMHGKEPIKNAMLHKR